MLIHNPQRIDDFDYTDSWLKGFEYDVPSQSLRLSIAYAHAMDEALPGDWDVSVVCRGVVYAKVVCEAAINLNEADVLHFAEEQQLRSVLQYIAVRGDEVTLGPMPFGSHDFGQRISCSGLSALRSVSLHTIYLTAEWLCNAVELEAVQTSDKGGMTPAGM